MADLDGAQLKITDNGIGMTAEVLERAVRAGWSGNNPIDDLGLFGMGFNIATARLGSVSLDNARRRARRPRGSNYHRSYRLGATPFFAFLVFAVSFFFCPPFSLPSCRYSNQFKEQM
jgi:hypothetical protein